MPSRNCGARNRLETLCWSRPVDDRRSEVLVIDEAIQVAAFEAVDPDRPFLLAAQEATPLLGQHERVLVGQHRDGAERAR